MESVIISMLLREISLLTSFVGNTEEFLIEEGELEDLIVILDLKSNEATLIARAWTGEECALMRINDVEEFVHLIGYQRYMEDRNTL